jgi:hypothetical protein
MRLGAKATSKEGIRKESKPVTEPCIQMEISIERAQVELRSKAGDSLVRGFEQKIVPQFALAKQKFWLGLLQVLLL